MAVKRFLIPVLAFVLGAGMLLAGCGGRGESGSQNGSAQPASGGKAADTGPAQVPIVDLSIMNYRDDDFSIADNTPVQKYLEDKYGVRFTIIRVAPEQRQTKIGLLIASGDLPDIFAEGGPAPVELVKQDALGEIKVEDIRQYAPLLYDSFIEEADVCGVDPFELFAIDGVNYSIPRIWGEAYKPVYSTLWRMDMLKDLGFTEPPGTIDELEAIAKAQKSKNPKVYTLGGAAQDAAWQTLSDIYNAFGGGNPGMFVYRDGKIINNLETPEMKEAIGLVANWLKVGYIDPEWITDSSATREEKFLNGKLLSLQWGYINQAYPEANYENIYNLAKKINPDAEVVFGPWLKGPDGTSSWMGWLPFAGQVLFSTEMASDPVKVKKYFDIATGYNTDEETYYTCTLGIKGKHWVRDGQGVPTPLAKFTSQGQKDEIGNSMLWSFLFNQDPLVEKIKSRYSNEYTKDLEKWKSEYFEKYKEYVGVDRMFIDAKLVNLPADFKREVFVCWDEFDEMNFILGKISMDQYDEMFKKWKEKGGDRLTQWYNDNCLKFFKK